jgi:hypothetical protein
MKILARTLLKYTTKELWDILTGSFDLVFDNGEIVSTNDRATLYSSYSWDFHREFQDTPLLPKHHLTNILGDSKRLGSDTHLELLGNAMWSVYDNHFETHPEDKSNIEFEYDFRDKLCECIYRYTNAMYNDLSYRLEEYVVSLDITDFIEVLNNPTIREANTRLQELPNPGQKDIEDTHKIVKSVLMSGKELPNNAISKASRSNLVSMGQVQQCVSARGVLTDVDSNVFRHPIVRGFAQGIRLLHDSLIESRSAAKSLSFSKTPLQQAEYFSRRLQLMSQIVCNLHTGDCGSTEYVYWNVRKTENRKGSVRQGDLKQLIGKNYMDDDGVLKTIHADSHELIGRTLKLRSVIHCRHPDPYGICSVCFGQLSLSVPKDTNIGQVCCTALASKSSQNVLSLKHLDGSSAVEGIILESEHRKYLRIDPSDENSYWLADNLKGKKVQFIILEDDAKNLTDVIEIKNIDDLNIGRVSELSKISIKIDDADPIGIDVSVGRRLASMTLDMLKLIRENRWTIDAGGDYYFDMSNWDWTKPFLTLPLKHINMSDHSGAIAAMLESSVDKMQERDKNVSPAYVLQELYDLVNEKLVVNLAVLEVVLYGIMIVSADNNDYSLPKPWTRSALGVTKMSMQQRSLSTAMAYEGHRDVLIKPMSFINTNRPNHIFDALLLPYEVLGDIS